MKINNTNLCPWVTHSPILFGIHNSIGNIQWKLRLTETNHTQLESYESGVAGHLAFWSVYFS